MYAGNLQLASGIIVSGNNFTKVEQFFKSVNLKGISKDTFYRVQKLYVAPAVGEMWDQMQETLLNSLKDKEVVIEIITMRGWECEYIRPLNHSGKEALYVCKYKVNCYSSHIL